MGMIHAINSGRYTDIANTAKILDCSERTVHRLIKQQLLITRKDGYRTKVSVDSILAYQEIKDEDAPSLKELAMRVKRLERVVEALLGHSQMPARKLHSSSEVMAEIARRHPDAII